MTLDRDRETQLFNYFNKSDARVAILTDGVVYKFYSDIVKQNVLDSDPFFEFNLLQLINQPSMADLIYNQLRGFSEPFFNVDEIIKAPRHFFMSIG
jgi:predicted type IV restriction endonuclease